MVFPYGKYKYSRNAAWRCLLDNNIAVLPVSVSSIARRNHIRLGAYSKNAPLIERLGLGSLLKNDGFSTLTSTGFIVLYRDDLDRCRIRFTLAHELGHIFLGHLLPAVNGSSCTILNREPTDNDDPLEHEANVFASRLLAPACVLWGLGTRSAEEISLLCDISLAAARIRAERMALLYSREDELLAAGRPSCFLLSPLERQVYQNFFEYIKITRSNSP